MRRTSVAHLEVVVLLVSRSLKQPNPKIKLLNDIDVLVRRDYTVSSQSCFLSRGQTKRTVEDALGNRKGVVSTNGGHVAVGAIAKLSMTIAGGSPEWEN